MTAVLSVVMPVFNEARTLNRAVESILNQTFEDFEFIIVDDGSTDDSHELLRWWERQDPRIRVISRPNGGISVALNTGIATAAARFVARMDADDWSFPSRFARQIEFLEANPDIAVVGTQVLATTPDGASIPSRYPTSSGEVHRRLSESCVVAHPTVMMRRSEVSHGYRPQFQLAQDYDLWLRVRDAGGRLANIESTELEYSTSKSSPERAALAGTEAKAARLCSQVRALGQMDPVDSVDAVDDEAIKLFPPNLVADLELQDLSKGLRGLVQSARPNRVAQEELVLELLRLLRAGDISGKAGAFAIDVVLRHRRSVGLDFKGAILLLMWALRHADCTIPLRLFGRQRW